MANIISTALSRLLPHGTAWSLTGQAKVVIDALADSIEKSRVYCSDAQLEAIPATVTETIKDWHDALGLEFDGGQTLAQQRDRIVVAHTSIGGANITYLRNQVGRQFPLVGIHELPTSGPPWDFGVSVMGAVQTLNDFNRLLGLVGRIFPLHIEPTFSVRVLANESTAYTGIAMTGRARCGKIA